MKIKSWVLSLMLPLLSIVLSVVLLILGAAIFTIAFGLLGGGLVPFIIITLKKVDISQFFAGKIIISGALVVGIILSWSVFFLRLVEGPYHVLVLPILTLIAELIFATTRKADVQQKMCLFLSSLVYVRNVLLWIQHSVLNPLYDPCWVLK